MTSSLTSTIQTELLTIKQGILDLGAVFLAPTADATHALYNSTFERLRESFKGTEVKRDVRYGEKERNVLDVYLPKGVTPGTAPVLVYVHGGGFFSGDKQWTEHAYTNIGHYFASKGIVTVIPNHQLVPNVTYPGGADDIDKVRGWIQEHIGKEEYGAGDPTKLVLCGQSSGAAHIASNIYALGDPTRSDSSHPLPRGVILLSAPLFFDVTNPRRAETLRHYYGTDVADEVFPRSPVGLLKGMSEGHKTLDPIEFPTLVVVGQLDTKEIIDANVLFFNTFREKSSPKGSLPSFRVLDGHNHMSNVLSIGTEDEEQGKMILDFVLKVTA